MALQELLLRQSRHDLGTPIMSSASSGSARLFYGFADFEACIALSSGKRMEFVELRRWLVTVGISNIYVSLRKIS
jgi:hypothetical protein